MTEGGITAFAIFFLVMMIGGFVFVIWFEIRSNRSEATKRIEAEKRRLNHTEKSCPRSIPMGLMLEQSRVFALEKAIKRNALIADGLFWFLPEPALPAELR